MSFSIKYKCQQGAVLLLFALLLLIGSTYSLVVKLNSDTGFYTRQSKETQESLRLAKQALIGYAINFPEIDAASGNDLINGPGYLPCPDLNNDGSAATNCAVTENTTIGRLPYLTLEVPELRDSSGARLWYVISDNYASKTVKLEPLNSETDGQLSVDGNADIVAVVIAPGAPTSNQNRNPADTTVATEIANYLEMANNNITPLDSNFISVDPTPTIFTDFNDRLITITRQELMEQIEKRVLGEVKLALTSYKNIHGAYPWLSPFVDPKAVARQLRDSAGSASNALNLQDGSTNIDFTDWGVSAGDMVYNLSDGSLGSVTGAVTSNSLTVASLQFGVENDFDEFDEYVVIPQAVSASLTGIASAGGDNNTLVDNSRALDDMGIAVGHVVDNLTDGSSSMINAMFTNSIEVDGLTGGTDNLFQLNDVYQIRSNSGVVTTVGSSATQLDDTNKNFIAMGVQAGDIVRNLTDGSIGTITTVNANSLIVDQLDFGTNNAFFKLDALTTGDSYAISRYNAVSNTREGHLSLHEVGELFPTSYALSWNMSVLNAGDIVFDTATFSNVEVGYRMAELYLQNYATTGSITIGDTDGFCIWSVANISDCYGRFTQDINISGTVTSGSNTPVITDNGADFITDNVKRGDIVQNYDDEFALSPAVSGTADEGGTTGTATTGSTNLMLEDSSKDFVALGINVGDDVNNLTDGSSGVVTNVTTDTINVTSLSGGTLNTFSDLDNYEILHSELFDATATFITDGVEAYNYMVFNTSTGVRAVITNVINENTLDAVELDNQASPITFSPTDNYTIYTPGIVVVASRDSSTQVTTTRSGAYNPDFDLLGGPYEEYYRIIPAGNSYTSDVDIVFSVPGFDTMQDNDADFSTEGIVIGDIIENTTDGSFGEIVNINYPNELRTILYGGGSNTFTVGDNYIIYHDYVYSRKHMIQTRYSGTQATKTLAQERVRDVCVGYDATCNATSAAVNFTGNGGVPLITIRDYEGDGVTEVGRATFTPSVSSTGSLLTSNIDYYFNDVAGDLPSWFVKNDWHKLVYIAYSAGDVPNAAACVPGTNCLTINGLNNVGAAVVNSNNNNALVIAAGMEINTTQDSNCNAIATTAQNRSNGTINEYYESTNCSAGDDSLQEQFKTNTFNDQVRVVEP